MRQGKILSNSIVVTEIKEVEVKTQTGILLPKQVTKNPTTRGRVVLVGDKTPDELITLEEGMVVLYPPLSAQKFVLEDEEFFLLPKARVLFAYRE